MWPAREDARPAAAGRGWPTCQLQQQPALPQDGRAHVASSSPLGVGTAQ